MSNNRNISTSVISLVGAIVVIGVLIWLAIAVSKKSNVELDQNKIVGEASYLVSQCKNMGDRTFYIKGKCLIWNLADNGRSSINQSLSPELKALKSDTTLTIFLITNVQEIPVGTYRGGDTGYRRDAEICVVYWPEKQAVCCHKIVGSEPPYSYSYKRGENTKEKRTGDYATNLLSWINSLRKY